MLYKGYFHNGYRGRHLDWRKALAEMREDRIKRRDVREELLRTLSRNTAFPLTAWRGNSGRRWIFSVHMIERSDILMGDEGVYLAVSRTDQHFLAEILSRAVFEKGDEAGFNRWRALAKAWGATEIHIHRLAETSPDRNFIADDLEYRDVAVPMLMAAE